MTKQEKKIKILFISVFLFMGFVILIFIAFIFYESLQNLHREVFKEYKEVYIKNSNNEAKGAVNYFIDSIKYEEHNLLEKCKEKLKQKTTTGYNIANFFYNKFHGSLPETQLKKITLAALKKANKDFIVFNRKGIILISPCLKSGFNVSVYQDAFGNNVFNIIKKEVEYNNNQESFLLCYTGKSKQISSAYKTDKLYKRIAYVKYFKQYGWYIASSVIYSDIEKKLQNYIKNKVNRFRYGPNKKNYVFILKILITNNGIKATRVANPNLPKKLIGTNVPLNIKDITGKMFFKEMLKVAFTKGEGFVKYKFKVPGTDKIKEKTTFVKYYPKWHWLICAGYYPDIFYSDLKTKDKKLKTIINESVRKLVTWVITLEIFLFLLILFFIEKIMKQIKEYRKKLVKKELFQKLLIESIPNPIFILDKNGDFININKAFKEFFYCKKDSICKELDNPDIMLIKDKAMEYLNNINPENPKEFNLADNMGRLRYIELHSSIFYDSSSKKAAGVIGVLFDITKSKITERELMEISIKDELTTMYNRRYFNQILPREMERAKRYKSPLSIIMYDIDHFKKINDNFGHQTGDKVLKTLSKIVIEHTRSVDFTFRIGGEEFVILLVETDIKEAYEAAEKIRKVVEKHHFEGIGRVTISLGVTTFADSDVMDTIIERIDEALYKSKNSGRNKTTIA